jgi:hypothetical protein
MDLLTNFFWPQLSLDQPELAASPEPDEPLAPRLTTFHLQSASPLFTVLPPELRIFIFELVLSPFPNATATAVPFSSFGFRPETEYPMVQDVALLRSCRSIYLETYTLPASLRTFVSWALVWAERAPQRGPWPARHGPGMFFRVPGPGAGLSRLVPHARPYVCALHVYAQQISLEREDWARACLGDDELALAASILSLRITVRHTDFWFWEQDRPLAMDGKTKYGAAWRAQFAAFPALDTLELELETLGRRRAELDALVAHVRTWQITLADGRVLTAAGVPLRSHTWDGTAQFAGAIAPPPGAKTLPYYVVVVRWVACRGSDA